MREIENPFWESCWWAGDHMQCSPSHREWWQDEDHFREPEKTPRFGDAWGMIRAHTGGCRWRMASGNSHTLLQPDMLPDPDMGLVLGQAWKGPCKGRFPHSGMDVMVNFMCQPNDVTGCPDIWSNIWVCPWCCFCVSLSIWMLFSQYSNALRIAFES